MDGSSTPTLFHPDLATLLASRGVLAPETLSRARLVRAETGERLELGATRLGLVSEQALAEAIAEATGLPIAAPEDYPAEAGPERPVSERFLRDFKASSCARPRRLEVAFVDPIDPYPGRGALACAGQAGARWWRAAATWKPRSTGSSAIGRSPPTRTIRWWARPMSSG